MVAPLIHPNPATEEREVQPEILLFDGSGKDAGERKETLRSVASHSHHRLANEEFIRVSIRRGRVWRNDFVFMHRGGPAPRSCVSLLVRSYRGIDYPRWRKTHWSSTRTLGSPLDRIEQDPYSGRDRQISAWHDKEIQLGNHQKVERFARSHLSLTLISPTGISSFQLNHDCKRNVSKLRYESECKFMYLMSRHEWRLLIRTLVYVATSVQSRFTSPWFTVESNDRTITVRYYISVNTTGRRRMRLHYGGPCSLSLINHDKWQRRASYITRVMCGARLTFHCDRFDATNVIPMAPSVPSSPSLYVCVCRYALFA